MKTAQKPALQLKKYEFTPGIDLTLTQANFVRALVRTGTNPTKAAEMAGFAAPKTAGYDMMRLPHVTAAIAFERQRYISGELANIATGTLKAVMEDKAAPASARVSAARTVLEMAGNLGKNKVDADGDKPLSEMTPEELASMIDKWSEERAQAAKPLASDEVEVLEGAVTRADVAPKHSNDE